MKTLTETPLIKNITVDLLTKLSQEWNEPSWVLNLRRKAFEQYEQLPWPNEKDEHWKRTDLNRLKWETLTLATTPADTFSSFEFPDKLRDTSVEWLTLETAWQTQMERVEKAWSEAIQAATNNKFMLLNLALATSGSCLIVPKGHVVKTPFQSKLKGGDKSTSHFVLNFIFIEEAAEAQLWEETGAIDSDQNHFVSSFTYLKLKENAKAHGYYVQSWPENVSHFQFHHVFQGAFSRYDAIAVALGGSVFHNETVIDLVGQGAENKILGVLFGSQQQNFTNWVTQNHKAPRTQSDIQYRGALKDKAHAFFTGMVAINAEGQLSDAYQAAKFLLLSPEARADAIPNLEILADDVKCSHGAAVGPVDEDQKYYLQTRGIPPAQAEEIIIQGFVEPVIAEVPSPIVQEQLRNFIEAKIKQS